VLGKQKDLAAVDANSLEDAVAIQQSMVVDADLGVASTKFCVY
jgi:hypothetical protein